MSEEEDGEVEGGRSGVSAQKLEPSGTLCVQGSNYT